METGSISKLYSRLRNFASQVYVHACVRAYVHLFSCTRVGLLLVSLEGRLGFSLFYFIGRTWTPDFVNRELII